MRAHDYPRLGLLVAGRWITDGRATRPVTDPANGETIAQLPLATAADIDEAADAAGRAFAAWAATPAIERAALLQRIAALIRRDESRLAAIITREQGKRLPESLQEVRNSADTFEWMAEEGKRAYGRTVPARQRGVDQIVRLEPVGPIAAFSPWNFPAVLASRKLTTALAAGCTLVLKPAEETPGILVAIANLCIEAGLPPGVLNLLYGEPAEVSSRLIEHHAIRKISFTGSVPVGRELAAKAGAVLKKATLELGGHAPVIVCADVDVARVVELALAAKYRNAGQLCICPTRFFIHDALYDRFVTAFAERAAALRVGSGFDAQVEMGPMAHPRRVDAMRGFCEDALEHGAGLLCGGEPPDRLGSFFMPTVLGEMPDNAAAMQQEPFGPLALMARFEHLDDAIARANATEYGLAAYAFTKSLSAAHAIEHGLAAGNVSLNTFALSAPEMPFCGHKASGLGSEMGLEGLRDHLHAKAVVRALA
ncbi:MAG: NAD-dependent succinate-semialdehyde dehydrogenase [Rubrivivax sp.]|nr:NAD-dependent succinate-semialdehyde dehydrogenase [Rubrivivax sp.]